MTPAERTALISIPDDHLKAARPHELALVARALELHTQLLSPLDYAVAVSGAKRYPHVELLNRYLAALIDGRLYFDGPGPAPVPKTGEHGEPVYDEDGFVVLVHPTRGDRPVYNLAISMPPRHGKSYLVSEHLPAWFLTNYPDYSVLLASYEATFAATWGGKVRDHIVDHPEFGLELTGGRNASKSLFDIEGHRGFMKTAGAGGPITGSGGHLIVVDDPIKNAADAMSAIERDNLDNWWRSTLYTRREPWVDQTPARVILMATRWHEDDLTGRRVPRQPGKGDRWCLLNLMAIFEPNDDQPIDPLGRAEGEALCPQRVPLRELQELRSDDDGIGGTWFEAMYQGRPSLDDGNLIKRPFNYYRLDSSTYSFTDRNGATYHFDEADCYRFAALDVAGTDTRRSDYTVFMVFDVTKTQPRYALLRAVERVRMTTEHHEGKVIEWYERYRPKALHIENKTFGTNLIGRLRRHPGLVVVPVPADTNKVVRALPVGYEINAGLLWFPESAGWLTEFERELTKFPNAKHDDQVDTLAYGVQVFKNLPLFLEPEAEPATHEEKVRAHRDRLASRGTSQRKAYPVIGTW